MNFVKTGKQELNIGIWELINKTEDNDTWALYERLKKPSNFVVSLYKKTCKLNNIDFDQNTVDKINENLDSLKKMAEISETELIREEDVKLSKDDENALEKLGDVLIIIDKVDAKVEETKVEVKEEPKVETTSEPKMISRKRA